MKGLFLLNVLLLAFMVTLSVTVLNAANEMEALELAAFKKVMQQRMEQQRKEAEQWYKKIEQQDIGVFLACTHSGPARVETPLEEVACRDELQELAARSNKATEELQAGQRELGLIRDRNMYIAQNTETKKYRIMENKSDLNDGEKLYFICLGLSVEQIKREFGIE